MGSRDRVAPLHRRIGSRGGRARPGLHAGQPHPEQPRRGIRARTGTTGRCRRVPAHRRIRWPVGLTSSERDRTTHHGVRRDTRRPLLPTLPGRLRAFSVVPRVRFRRSHACAVDGGPLRTTVDAAAWLPPWHHAEAARSKTRPRWITVTRDPDPSAFSGASGPPAGPVSRPAAGAGRARRARSPCDPTPRRSNGRR
jgi:hypothetical protein